MHYVEPIRARDLYGPFRGSHALAAGVVTRRQLRSALFLRLFRDVYLPAGMPVTHAVRCRAAALAVPAGVLTGHSAAVLRGLDLATASDPVELLTMESDRFRAHPGMHVRRVPVDESEYEWLDGLLVATPLRMTFDLLLNTKLRKTLPEAVGALDAVLRHPMIEPGELGSALTNRHDHGIARARAAFELADPRAESVPESVLRVRLLRAGVELVPQFEVWRDGLFLARVDLAAPGQRVAVEYDGEWHREQVAHDARRRARLRAAGWTVVVVDKTRLREDLEGVIREVRAATCARIAG